MGSRGRDSPIVQEGEFDNRIVESRSEIGWKCVCDAGMSRVVERDRERESKCRGRVAGNSV